MQLEQVFSEEQRQLDWQGVQCWPLKKEEGGQVWGDVGMGRWRRRKRVGRMKKMVGPDFGSFIIILIG
jgi:hypothetical protein